VTQTLNDILLNPAKRADVVADLNELVGQEVSEKSGVSGAAVKLGYSTVTKLKPGIVPAAVDKMLPDFADALEPFYKEFQAQGGDFGAFLASRGEAAAEALLSVTDARAAKTSSDAIKKAYEKLRPNARKNVEEALPRLGAVIQKYAQG
jgi:hypothetical protein